MIEITAIALLIEQAIAIPKTSISGGFTVGGWESLGLEAESFPEHRFIS